MPILKGYKDLDNLFHKQRLIEEVYIKNRLVYEYIEGFIFFTDKAYVSFSDAQSEKCNDQ